ncbi:TRAP transporter large permease [Alkalihalobacillus sp. MEB130]|nr:TRAP transporter large permease [Alkalihalobacillus sp. MEB130]
MIAIFFFSLILFLFLSVPIATSLGIATVIGLSLGETLPLTSVPQRIFVSLNSFPLMAIPFFILAGVIMQAGGMSRRLVNFATSLVGHATGGLAMVAIITSLFFAAISGSGAATTAAIGSILIPAMIAKGYDIGYASANQAVSGSLGVIIPPSIPLILYGVSAQTSVGDMFLAGIFPGLLITISLLITAYIISKKRGYHGVERKNVTEIWSSFKGAFWAILMPIIVLGGIYAGVFTPTEASVIAVVYSLIVGLLIYREIKLKEIMKILENSAITTSVIMIIIGTAGLFSFFVSMVGIPDLIANFITNFTTNSIIFLLLINLILLLAGTVLDATAAILIFVPLLLPIALSFGIDPVHFGIIMVINLSIGYITPPVGINLFVAAKISNMKIVDISKAILPFLLILIINLMIITYLPTLSTWLPSLMK